jgi:hypothetical protein
VLAAATIAVAAAAGATTAAIAATHGSSQSNAASSPNHRPGGPGHGPGRGGFDADLTAAASYLGVSKATLQTQLKAGKTLAQIASSTSGKSTAGLIDALVSAATKRLDVAVASGKVTKAHETSLLAGLEQRVKDFVNGARPAGSPPGRQAGTMPPAPPAG